MLTSGLSRAISVVSATALLFSSSFGGFYAASETIGASLSQLMRGEARPLHRLTSRRLPGFKTRQEQRSGRDVEQTGSGRCREIQAKAEESPHRPLRLGFGHGDG